MSRKRQALCITGATLAIAGVALAGVSRLSPQQARACSGKPTASRAALAAAAPRGVTRVAHTADTTTVELHADTTCPQDFFRDHVYKNGTKSDQTAVIDAQNSGECDLTVVLPDGSRITVPAGGQHGESVTIPAGGQISARCEGNEAKKCKWSIRITIALPAKVGMVKPKDGGSYRLGKVTAAKYHCKNAVSCDGTVPNGAPFDTSTPGPHQFVVVARNELGFVTTKQVVYTVVPH